MKEENHSKNRKFTVKDIIVIILSIAALIALILILKFAKEIEAEKEAELNNISEQIQEDGYIRESDSSYAGLSVNEINEAGWIEFYNAGKGELDISGITVFLNGEQIYQIPEGNVISPGGLTVIETGKKIGKSDHDILSFDDKDNNRLADFIVPKLGKNESYGYLAEGQIARSYLTASKGRKNEDGEVIEKEEMFFSVPGGFYDEAFQLEIKVPDEWTVYYTTDGTEPTMESEVYTEPISIVNRSGSQYEYAAVERNNYSYSYEPSSIHMGTVVRAIAMNQDGKQVGEETESYFIGLAGSSEYKDMPVLSITTDPKNLFDYFEGMYVSGRSYEDAIARGETAGSSANYLNGWVKTAHIEFFESQKDKTYEGKIALSMLEDYSVASAQKGFWAVSETGGAWEGSSLTNYLNDISRTLTIQTNKYDNSYKLREYLAASLLENSTVGLHDQTPCIVFIDGEYWGIYMLKAEYDAQYIQKHYSIGTEKEIAFVKSGIAEQYQEIYNDFYDYVTTQDMSDPDIYAQVETMMDVQSYLDYVCANMYLANSDYRIDGYEIWRTVDSEGAGYADGKWRWLMGRLDNTMDNGTVGNKSTSSIDTFLQPGITEDLFFQSLLCNESFQKQLRTTMTQMAEEVFSIERVENALQKVKSTMEKPALSSYRRFFGYTTDTFYPSEVEKILDFFEERADYILKYTEEVIETGGNLDLILGEGENGEQDAEADGENEPTDDSDEISE